MANLLVSTSNNDERARLQEEFSIRDHFFIIPQNSRATLEAFFRAISFQYFQNYPSSLAQKIISFAENMLNNICSLTLLREILKDIKIQEDHFSLMKKYFQEIDQQVSEKNNLSIEKCLSLQQCLRQQNDKLFQLAYQGEMRQTRILYTTDFYQDCEIGFKYHYPQNLNQKTQVPSSNSVNPQQKQLKDKPQKMNQVFIDFGQNYYESDWWKAEKGNDSSKQISQFDCKAKNLFNQKSIGKIVMDQYRYDLNREIELGKEVKKHEEVQGTKYKKLMKDKLLSAKLKKKKRV